jgi:hypothetical protein
MRAAARIVSEKGARTIVKKQAPPWLSPEVSNACASKDSRQKPYENGSYAAACISFVSTFVNTPVHIRTLKPMSHTDRSIMVIENHEPPSWMKGQSQSDCLSSVTGPSLSENF